MIEKTIPDFLTSAEILAQTGEEAAELAQAALKLRRALTGENPTPKSIAECLDDIFKKNLRMYWCAFRLSVMPTIRPAVLTVTNGLKLHWTSLTRRLIGGCSG